MDYKAIYQEILNEEAVLFLGAGFSVGNRNINGEFKTGRALANHLCEIAQIMTTDNLNIACSKYIRNFDNEDEAVSSLANELKKEFTSTSINDTHEWIIGLPWKRIYTTNYDDIIEKASGNLKIKRKSISILREAEPEAVTNSIVHINGYIHDIDENTGIAEFNDLFKITHESFFQDLFLESNWKSVFVDDLYEAKRVVFLGYSLDYDFSLQSLIKDEAKNKCIFIDFSEKDEQDSDKAYRFESLGQYNFEGVSSFSNHLKVYENKVFKQVSLTNKAFERIVPEKYPFSQLGSITGNDIFKFYIMGKFQAKFVNTEDKVIINRYNKIKEVEGILKERSIRTLIVHSRLGNGKSIFKHSLMNNLSSLKPVYELISTENIFNEIEKIEGDSKNYDEYYIIIDDFGEFMSKMEIIYKKVSTRARIIMFVRTPIKDNLCNQLYRKGIVKAEEVEEVDLNKLDDRDIKDIYDVFSTYGYWGNLKTTQREIHLAYYKSNCKSEFSNLLYFILDSENIKEKVKDVITAVKNRQIVQDYLITNAILSKVGIKMQCLQILELLNANINLFYRVIKSPELVEVIDSQNHDAKVLSPIFSDFLLKEFDNKLILKLAAQIYNNSSKVLSGDIRYSIRKNLVSRSNIKLITTNEGNDLDDLAITFYDSLRESRVSKENPFYWLQYAISLLNKNRLAEAKLYFDNAYKISTEFFENPDLSHINTHYSRYLFEMELQKNSYIEMEFESIKKADRMLFVENNNRGSNLKYCLRQIGHYKLIYDKFIKQSDNRDWWIEYNKMLERIVKVAISYIENSNIEKYEVDYQAKKNMREMCDHFKEHVYESLVNDLCKIINKK